MTEALKAAGCAGFGPKMGVHDLNWSHSLEIFQGGFRERRQDPFRAIDGSGSLLVKAVPKRLNSLHPCRLPPIEVRSDLRPDEPTEACDSGGYSAPHRSAFTKSEPDPILGSVHKLGTNRRRQVVAQTHVPPVADSRNSSHRQARARISRRSRPAAGAIAGAGRSRSATGRSRRIAAGRVPARKGCRGKPPLALRRDRAERKTVIEHGFPRRLRLRPHPFGEPHTVRHHATHSLGRRQDRA
jgi:hypothetical protein